jgi:hypothetical protein
MVVSRPSPNSRLAMLPKAMMLAERASEGEDSAAGIGVGSVKGWSVIGYLRICATISLVLRPGR